MENKSTFQEQLEKVLGIAGERANPHQRFIEGVARRAGTIDSVNYGVASLVTTISDKRNQLMDGPDSEDFIIGPLPRETRLYSPADLIQVAKDFYATRGLSPLRQSISIPNWEEIIMFGNSEVFGSVQFDLGRGFRRDDKYELWVTTDFYNRTKVQI